jgi:hypothetical protein
LGPGTRKEKRRLKADWPATTLPSSYKELRNSVSKENEQEDCTPHHKQLMSPSALENK